MLVEQRNYPSPMSSEVVWQHGDPLTGSVRQSLKTGELAIYSDGSHRELEPLGGIVPPYDPYYEEQFNEPAYEYGGNVRRPEYGCTLPETGQPAPCTVAAALMNYLGQFNWGFNQSEKQSERARRLTIPNFIRADNRRDDEYERIPGLRRVAQYEGREFVGFMWVVDNSTAAHTQQQESRNRRDFRESVQAARDILGQNGGDNPCANLFGGAGLDALNAIEALVNQRGDDVFERFTNRDGTANNSTGIRMNVNISGNSGQFAVPPSGSYGSDSPTSIQINTNGPFVSAFSPARVGGYSPASLQSRVTQLLHEIGHLVYKDVSLTYRVWQRDGRRYGPYKSYVPNRLFGADVVFRSDGTQDASPSEAYTTQVLNACREQINALRR